MSDIRSLLKAKRQEIRVDHPLASYTSSGQLRCNVCETNIKHPCSLDGHLGSKAHRTNTARVREEKRRKELEQEEEETKRLKRKVSEDGINGDARGTAKRSRVTTTPTLPSDFFSDPSRAPLSSYSDSDDEGGTSATATIAAKPTDAGGGSSLDQEWLRFQQSVINAPDAAATYDRATVFAEPVLVSESNASVGFPIHDSEGAHTSSVTKADENERRRRDQEERELIMDRLMDEERAQEEADMKVAVMKSRLAALRKRRDAFRSPRLHGGIA